MIFEIPKKECCATTSFKNQDTMLFYLIDMIDTAYMLDTSDKTIEFKDNDFFNIQALELIHKIMYEPVLGMIYYMMQGRVMQDTQDAFLHILAHSAIHDYYDCEIMPSIENIEEKLSNNSCPPLGVINEMRDRRGMGKLEEYIEEII